MHLREYDGEILPEIAPILPFFFYENVLVTQNLVFSKASLDTIWIKYALMFCNRKKAQSNNQSVFLYLTFQANRIAKKYLVFNYQVCIYYRDIDAD